MQKKRGTRHIPGNKRIRIFTILNKAFLNYHRYDPMIIPFDEEEINSKHGFYKQLDTDVHRLHKQEAISNTFTNEWICGIWSKREVEGNSNRKKLICLHELITHYSENNINNKKETAQKCCLSDEDKKEIYEILIGNIEKTTTIISKNDEEIKDIPNFKYNEDTTSPSIYYRIIQELYNEIFNPETTLDEKKVSSKQLVEIVTDKIFFQNKFIQEQFYALHGKNLSIQDDGSIDYMTVQIQERITFLSDYAVLSNRHGRYLKFIHDAEIADDHELDGLGTNDNDFLHILKVFILEFLHWFLSFKKQDKNYLTTLEIIRNDDPNLHKKLISAITTFWNIKEDEKTYWGKRQTVLAFIITIVFIFVSPLFTAVMACIGVYISIRKVFSRKLKIQRILFYSICFVVSIAINATAVEYINQNIYGFKDSDEKGVFQLNPQHHNSGFMDIVTHKLVSNELVRSKEIVAYYLDQDNTFPFSVSLHYENIGDFTIQKGKAQLNIKNEGDRILLIGSLENDFGDKVYDTVMITHIQPNYKLLCTASSMTGSLKKDCPWNSYCIDLEQRFFNGQEVLLEPLNSSKKDSCSTGHINMELLIKEMKN